MDMFYKFFNKYTLLFLGIGFVFFPFLVKCHFWRLKKIGKTAMATVIENKRVYSSDKDTGHGFGGISYHAVVEYVIDDVKHIRRSNNGYMKPHYVVGQQVKIYHTDSKNNGLLIDSEDKRPLFIIFPIIGGLMIVINLSIATIFSNF